MKMMCDASKLLIFLMISFSFETPFGQPPDPDPDPDSDSTWLIYSNSFALELISKTQNITALAQRYGFHLITKHQYFNVYRMVHPEIPVLSKRKARKFLARLKNDSRVKHVSQLQQLLRTRRGSHIYDSQKFSNGNTTERHKSSIKTADEVQKNRNFTDPYFIDQWYLNNAGDVTDDSRFNLNVIPAWNKNITGTGVRICVLDDGIDYRHPDIARNYDAKASTDLNGEFGDSDPMPDDSNPKNSHGTHCAGVAAAEANNGVCGVGVAYHASIGGIRMLDGIITDLLEAEAMLFKPDYIDIYTASWGPVDDGIRMEGPGTFTKQALQTGVQQGRNGLGSIYVWAAGNGGNRFDDCNADGYVGSIETIAVGSVSDKGLKPTFMEECPSILAVVPTGDEPAKHAKEAKKEKIQVSEYGGPVWPSMNRCGPVWAIVAPVFIME
ncbi:PC3-like endoprotease variant B [Argonauta hians]